MNREVLERRCEQGILYLVLGVLVFGPLALGAVRAMEFAALEGLTIGVILLWGARLWLNPRARLLWPPICWAVLAFVGYAIGRYLTADIEYVARQELARVIVYAFLFFAILNNLHRQETTQILSFALIFLAMAVSGYALYQFLTGSDYVWGLLKPYPHRGSGTYICPNHLGGFLELLLPLALTYSLLGRVKPVTRILLGYAALVILAGIGATISRGAWAATALALLAFFLALLLLKTFRVPALIALALVLVGIVLVFPRNVFVQMRVKQLLTPRGNVDDDMRFALWRPAFEMWRDHPWWGVGPAHFDARFPAYRPEGVQATPDRVHNDYLNTLVDWGVVGTVLVGSAWVLLGIGMAKTSGFVRMTNSDLGGKAGSNKYAFFLGAGLGLFAILVHSCLDFNMHIPANAILVITLMALLTANLRFATDRYWIRAGPFRRAAVTVCLLCGAAYLGLQGWKSASEFVWLERAVRAPIYSQTQMDCLFRAQAIEPMNAQTAYSIGEGFRHQSQIGIESLAGDEGMDYRRLADKAMEWFGRGAKLNPWDSRLCAGYGWCLDWVGRQSESAQYFDRAEQLDPNNYFNLNNIALHFIQMGNYAAAIPWFERSYRLTWRGNDIARNYLEIANIRLSEGATNELRAKLGFLQN